MACLAIGLLVYILAGSLDPTARMTAAIFAGAVAFWITEALPLAMTALLSTVALVVTGVLPAKDAFGAYGDQIILLFVGSFIIAKAMELSGLNRRLAYWLLSKPWATRSASSTVFALGLIACVISLFVSNTATTVMLLPIGLTVLSAIGVHERGNPVATNLLLMLTWASSIAVGTIVGTPPNVLGVGLIREATGVNVNFVQWMIFAMPVTVVMLFVAWLVLRPRGESAPSTAGAHSLAQDELRQLGRLSSAERATTIAFFVALVLWLLPGITEYVLGSTDPLVKLFNARIPEAVAALVGATLLFLIPCKGEPGGRAMTWQQASTIEWGTIMLFAGGLALGKAAFDSGLAKTVGESFARATGANDAWTIAALAIGLAIVVSELASNTAAANVVVPVAIALAQGAGVNPVPAALGAVIGANLGFMLPISTAPNAVVYSSGLIPAKVMMKRGLLFDVIGFVVTLVCLRLFLPLAGLV